MLGILGLEIPLVLSRLMYLFCHTSDQSLQMVKGLRPERSGVLWSFYSADTNADAASCFALAGVLYDRTPSSLNLDPSRIVDATAVWCACVSRVSRLALLGHASSHGGTGKPRYNDG